MTIAPLSEDDLRNTVDCVERHNGNRTKAGEELGINRRTVNDRLKRAARKGIAPGHFDRGVAPGYEMKKVTIHRDADGVIKNTWERQSPDEELTVQLIEAAVAGMLSRVTPRKPVKPPKVCESKLLTQYCFTDYHMNMLAWHAEGGANWDLEIAKKMAARSLEYLVSASPAAGTGVVLIQGDWQHYDSMTPVTPTSKHPVDAAARAQQGIDASMETIELLVHMALQKHKKVILQICEGNHDIYTSMMLRKAFARLYRDEPRVEVPDEPTPFYAIQFGKTALFYHHGHKKNWKDLPLVFAHKFSKIWGETLYRYGNTGHYHHEKVEEFNGIKMMQHPTMAANDSHGSHGGYDSLREMHATTFHKDFGKAYDVVVNPAMIGMV